MKKLFLRFKERIKEYFKDDILRRIIANSSYLFSAQGFVTGLSIVRGFLEYKLLLPSEMGLLAVMSTFTNVANKFTSFRIDEYVVRFVRQYENENDQEKAAAVYKSAILLETLGALSAFLLVYFLTPIGIRLLAKEWIDLPNIETYFVLFGLTALANFMFNSSRGLLQVFDKFKTIAIINATQSIVSFVLIVPIFFMGGGFVAILSVRIINKFVGSAGMIIAAIITANKQWGKKWFRVSIRALMPVRSVLLRFVFSTNISGTISLIAKDSEALWISAFLSTTEAGFYDLAKKFIGYIQMPVSYLSSTTYPELSREIVKEKWSTVQKILKRGSTMGLAYMIPVVIGAVFLGKPIIILYSGEEFLPAYPMLLVMLAGYFFMNVFFWNRIALLALNHPVYPTIVNFVGMVIKVACIFWFVPQYGFIMFAALLSGYFIFTISLSSLRTIIDVRNNLALEASA